MKFTIRITTFILQINKIIYTWHISKAIYTKHDIDIKNPDIKYLCD